MGIIQQPSLRLKLHPYFAHVVYAVNKALPRAVSIIDGRYGLNRSGPMLGDVVDLNWMIVANDLFAADLVCCELMKIPARRVRHFRYALRQERIHGLEDIVLSSPISKFEGPQFYLKRTWTDYPGLITFNSRLAYVGYQSPLAGLLHRVLYRFRDPFYPFYGREGAVLARR